MVSYIFFLLRTCVAECEATLALALNVSAYGEIQITEISNSKRVTYNIKYHYVVEPFKFNLMVLPRVIWI